MQTKTIAFSLPTPFFEKITKDPKDHREELWILVKNSKVLMQKHSSQIAEKNGLSLLRPLYLGVCGEHSIYTAEVEGKMPEDVEWVDLKALFGLIDDTLFSLAGRAVQLAMWNRAHQYCGECGKKTIERSNERAKECLHCKELYFPRISPAIMALVRRKDEILLARSPHFPKGVYSVLAGFVSPGETLEECVRREVFEEVGLKVGDISYFGSQPWPFPNSLMIAFTCNWVEGEIEIDPTEIEDARWFNKGNLPELPPEISISRFLIDSAF